MAETGRVDEPIKQTQRLVAACPSSRGSLRGFFSCEGRRAGEVRTSRRKRMGCSGSFCRLRDHQRPEASLPEPCNRRASVSGCSATERSRKMPLAEVSASLASVAASSSPASVAAAAAVVSSSSSPLGGSFRGMNLGRLSGCYECHMVVDPINGTPRYSSVRATISSCPDCGEIFMKADSLELHQAVRHAVSELGSEDTGRKIVEIIFQSSWLKKRTPACRIERILKVRNTWKTMARFEDYRDCIKSKASKLAKRHPRSTADGNELLRFHCTTFRCALGLNGVTNLCDSIPECSLCSIIREGFKADEAGRIRTMATSGRAHDAAAHVTSENNERIAMLVCRVIAGRVRRSQEAEEEEYDSAGGTTAAPHSNLDEMFVFNPRAILPCFVVIYRC
ncbi:hypothetical protein B296_00042378 [Ensete ventricosum]|uniref:C2H2-type domain-containing protein n=1 Tax=Ensete ventricosum TaxID=4639 RepID=A0A426YJQ3_ENSVE|nr:hypothetical protein B296_00042378 [Ensete ventricosum]